jgi:hypothetical protein
MTRSAAIVKRTYGDEPACHRRNRKKAATRRPVEKAVNVHREIGSLNRKFGRQGRRRYHEEGRTGVPAGYQMLGEWYNEPFSGRPKREV